MSGELRDLASVFIPSRGTASLRRKTRQLSLDVSVSAAIKIASCSPRDREWNQSAPTLLDQIPIHEARLSLLYFRTHQLERHGLIDRLRW